MSGIDIQNLNLEKFTSRGYGAGRKVIADSDTLQKMREMKRRGKRLREIADFAGYKNIATVSAILTRAFPEDRSANYYQNNPL